MTSFSFVSVAENKRMTKESHIRHIRNAYLSVTWFLFLTRKMTESYKRKDYFSATSFRM